ncbi:MAG: sensor histidine kinase [Umezawaea sp.]
MNLPRRWVALDGLVALAYGMVLIALRFSDSAPHGGFRLSPLGIVAVVDRIGFAGLVCTTLLSLPVVLRRRYPVGAAVVLATAAVVPPWPAWASLFAWACVLYTVASTRPVSTALAVLATGFVAQMAVLLATRLSGDGLVWSGTIMATAWAVGCAVGRRRAHQAELRLRHTRRVETEERLRIARELHDVVAHSMSVITMQAGFGHLVLDDRPDQARAALDAIRTTGRDTLVEMRRLLGVLREDASDIGLAGLDHLLARTAHAGVDVELEITGCRRALPAGLDLSAYRIVQEALTNVVKHAATPTCLLAIEFGEDELRIEVIDHGRGAQAPALGHGLYGMRERVAAHGGTLDAASTPGGGFRVLATLPTPDGDR